MLGSILFDLSTFLQIHLSVNGKLLLKILNCTSVFFEGHVLILQGIILLQRDLDGVCSFAKLWNLRLNINKCVAMRFGACNSGNNLHCSCSIDGKVLDFVASLESLVCWQTLKLHFYVYICSVVIRAGG